jgi:hypothetical protein
MSLQASWERTTGHLLEARSMLAVSDDLLLDFTEYLEHNELELALDELEGVALEIGAPEGFWKKANEAAREMGLLDHVRRYSARISGKSTDG